MAHTPVIAVVLTLFIQGCAMERSLTSTVDNRPCVANYSTEGGFWMGKQFKTYEDFPTIDKNTAFDKLAARIASSGLQIINSNKELGILSASTPVTAFTHSTAKTVPLNVVVQNINPRGIRVEVVYTLSAGLATSADMVQEKFCNLLASVSR
ncbi:MAG: hypothetical protein MN733_20925 [Nitrososphaera sp.]|nr:hypothetical protein [Nitrososphaera sp.]